MKRIAAGLLALTLGMAGTAWAKPARCAMPKLFSACGCCDAAPTDQARLGCSQQPGAASHDAAPAEAERSSPHLQVLSALSAPQSKILAINGQLAIAPSPVPSHAPPKRYLLSRIFRL